MASGESRGFAPGSFSDVDASGQASQHAAYLERVAEEFADLRRSWLSALKLQPGQIVLDAGSGAGEVTRSLGEMVAPGGRAIGADRSEELVARARLQSEGVSNVEYEVGDVTDLPFERESFDVVYCERVFQHLANPSAAMRELFRVLRLGGQVAIIDPDHTRSVTDADDRELSDLLTDTLLRTVANPTSGRRLQSQMRQAGFIDVAVHPTLWILTDAARQRALSPRPPRDRVDELVADGSITRERADAYLADQEAREAEGRFLFAVPLYCVTGTKPADGR